MARTRMGTLNKIAAAAGAGLLATAVMTELRKPPGERTWHGTVAGSVPYDFRFPTPERTRERLWNPDGPLFTPHTWGVGWSLNVGRLVRMATARSRSRRG